MSREVTVDGLAPSGDGLATVDGRVERVAGALPGERVTVVRERGQNLLVAITEASKERVEPPCKVFPRCGGCAWQHASEGLQRESRLSILRRALPKELRDRDVAWHPSSSPWAWRTRARLAWTTTKGVAQLGFRARASDEVVGIDACPVLDARLEAVLPTLALCLGAFRGRGELSLALGAGGRPVASVHPEGELTPEAYALCDVLVREGFAGAALWVPGATAPAVAGDPRPVAEGADGVDLVLGIDGFAQAHGALNRDLAATVARAAAARDRKVLELYAGAGNFTVLLAREARAVTAVESERRAVAALEENLRARGITNVTARHDTAEAAADVRADVVVLDPPRTGAREVCEAIVKRSAARRVVYVSCDPPTLGRDLAILGARYELASLDAFEMFPHTAHVESVAVLTARPGRRPP